MARLRIKARIPVYIRGMCFSFPLLPYNKMAEGLDIIDQHLNNIAADIPNALAFGQYLRTYWLKPVTSVFGSRWRTNNFVESGNKYIKKRFGARPNFWVFIGM